MSRTAVARQSRLRAAARPVSIQAVAAAEAVRPEALLALVCATGFLAILAGAIAAAIVSPVLSRHGATVGLAAWACSWIALWTGQRRRS